ncbi:hypothetical protein EON63_14510 [archaeon]|nr:MAG: hypothetical protein EON63_14510 [archaeon]
MCILKKSHPLIHIHTPPTLRPISIRKNAKQTHTYTNQHSFTLDIHTHAHIYTHANLLYIAVFTALRCPHEVVLEISQRLGEGCVVAVLTPSGCIDVDMD